MGDAPQCRLSKINGMNTRETYQLVAAIDVHESIEQIQNLDPQHAYVCRLAITRLELHETLAEQCGCAQACLGHAHRVAHEDLLLQELVEEREDDAVEDLLDLPVVPVVEREVRPEQDALEVHDGAVSDFARRI